MPFYDQFGNELLRVTSSDPNGNYAFAATTATNTALTPSVTSTQIYASNPSRKGLMLLSHTASGDKMYVLFGAGTASPTNWTFILFPDQLYTMDSPIYTGPIQAVWDSTGGTANGTELTN